MVKVDLTRAILSNARFLDGHRKECEEILSQGELLEVCADLSYLVKEIKRKLNVK